MTKEGNRITFYGEGYGYVQLVKRSVTRRWFSGPFYDQLKLEYECRSFYYWKGQLVHDWDGLGPGHGEAWGNFRKGQVVWLNADTFKITGTFGTW